MDDLQILGLHKKVIEKLDQAKDDEREDQKLLQLLRIVQSKQFNDYIEQCDHCKQKTVEKLVSFAKDRGFEIESKPVEHKIELTENMNLGDKPSK